LLFLRGFSRLEDVLARLLLLGSQISISSQRSWSGRGHKSSIRQVSGNDCRTGMTGGPSTPRSPHGEVAKRSTAPAIDPQVDPFGGGARLRVLHVAVQLFVL
jgi:hypothetical protein